MTNRAKKERGKTRTQRTQTQFIKAPHKSNPGGHEEVRISIPNQSHRFNYTRTLVHRWTSWEEPREGESLRRWNEMAKGEGDSGSLILIYQGYYTIPNTPLNILSRTTWPKGIMVQPEIVFIRRPPRLSWDRFASTRTPRCRHMSSVPPRNLRTGFEVQIVLRLNPPNRPRVAYSIRVPRNSMRVTTVLDRLATKSSRASARRACLPSWLGQHGHSLVQMSATMAGHPPYQFLDPSLTSVLHRSRSIDMARPYFPFISPSTTASELHTCASKSRDMLHNLTHAMVSSQTQSKTRITLTITH
jgi:hypothetical protein